MGVTIMYKKYTSRRGGKRKVGFRKRRFNSRSRYSKKRSSSKSYVFIPAPKRGRRRL